MSSFHAVIRSDGAKSGAAFPLLIGGQAVGVMLFLSAEKDTFTPEFVELLQRLADNVSFALENFDRADEKTKADERIEYLASHDSLTRSAQSRNVQRAASPRDRDGAAAISGDSRCCSSISTGSR